MTEKHFPRDVLDAIERRASLRIRAGSAKHRFLGMTTLELTAVS